jgi:ElaB/YqjD/DUF883 family membrane-anchored ribosome-binding protein
METNRAQHSQPRERLLDDLKMVMKDAEDLLRNTRQQAGEGYQAARARFESTLGSAKTRLSSLEADVAENAREAMKKTDQYVQSNPWQAVGAGAVAGLLVGLLIGRR